MLDRTHLAARGPTTRLAVVVALLCAAVAGGASAQPASAPGEDTMAFEATTDPTEVVLTLTEEIGALEAADPGPSLTLYGDGRLVVHYPAYMKRAGDYELRLGPGEMHEMLGSLLEKRVVEFDGARVKRAKRDALAARRARRLAGVQLSEPELQAAFDSTVTHIGLRLERYRPARAAGAARRPAEQRGVERSIAWHGLRADAKQYPEVEEIQALAAAQRELLALMERSDLVKLSSGVR